MILETKMIHFKGMPFIQKVKFKTPFTMQGEIQDFACFFYVIQGKMNSYDSRGIHQLSEKEAILKNCNSYVQKFESNESSEECEVVAIYLYPQLLKEVYKNEVPSFLTINQNKIPKKLIGNELIEQYMNQLTLFFASIEHFDDELGILKLKELLLILLKSQNQANIRSFLSEIFTPVNLEFKQAIENNLFNHLSMEELAFICKMSLSSFKREFKKQFDTTPAKYIKSRRLEHAATLLRTTDDAISSIAYDSGFQDVTTFSSIFKEKFGQSPREYRLA